MADETFEFTADKGQTYVVRPCDDEDGCVVIEQWVTPRSEENDEPTHDVHVPADLVTVVAKALLAHQQRACICWCAAVGPKNCPVHGV